MKLLLVAWLNRKKKSKSGFVWCDIAIHMYMVKKQEHIKTSHIDGSGNILFTLYINK